MKPNPNYNPDTNFEQIQDQLMIHARDAAKSFIADERKPFEDMLDEAELCGERIETEIFALLASSNFLEAQCLLLESMTKGAAETQLRNEEFSDSPSYGG